MGDYLHATDENQLCDILIMLFVYWGRGHIVGSSEVVHGFAGDRSCGD